MSVSDRWHRFDSKQVEPEVPYAAQQSVKLPLVERFGDQASVTGFGFDRDPGNVARKRSPRRPSTVTVYRLDCMVLLPMDVVGAHDPPCQSEGSSSGVPSPRVI
jgi:hypothetical protein